MKVSLKIWMLGLLSLALLTDCNKEVGPDHLPLLPELARVPIPKFVADTTLDAVIQDPEEFHAAFSLGLYFPDDVQPASADIVVAMNGNYEDIRTLKADITSFPAEMNVTAADLANLFDIPVNSIVPGYEFEVRATFVLEDGTVLPGFADGIGAKEASTDLNNFPGDYATSLTYTAVCPLDLDAFIGDMTVDDPYFWEGSYPVKVTQPEPGVLRVTGINEDPDGVVEIKINSRTFAAVISSQMIAENPPYASPYTNLTMTGTGKVNSCDNIVTVDVEWTVDQGSFGDGSFILHQ